MERRKWEEHEFRFVDQSDKVKKINNVNSEPCVWVAKGEGAGAT